MGEVYRYVSRHQNVYETHAQNHKNANPVTINFRPVLILGIKKYRLRFNWPINEKNIYI